MTDERLAVTEIRLECVEQRMVEGFAARDKALEVALVSLYEKLRDINEFRGAMQDQAGRFITRAEHEHLIARINQQALDAKSIAAEYVPRIDMQGMASRMETVEKAQSAMQARYAMVALVFSSFAVVANLVAIWWHQIPDISH